MTEFKSYLFEFSYGDRMTERPFLIALMERFDKDTLTGITMFANNNPYNFEFLLLLSFEKNDKEFDGWLKDNYPEKHYRFLYNYSLEDIIKNQFGTRRYNAFSFSTLEQLDTELSDYKTTTFQFPTQKIMKELWGDQGYPINKYNVFLSHANKDKTLIDNIFKELQKVEAKVWYDKLEIDLGVSITDKINDGLAKSNLGLLCLSRNFLDSHWAKSEMNYFLQKRLTNKENNLACINLDLEHEEIPPLLQDYFYLNITDEGWENKLIDNMKKRTVYKQ